MANFIAPRTWKVIPIAKQVHPRVLVADRDCSSCIEFKQTPSFDYCLLHDKQTSPYNECSAFQKASE